MDERKVDPKIVGVIAGLVGFGVGFGLGYILGKRKQEYIRIPAPSESDETWSLADLEVVPDEIVVEDVGEAFVQDKLKEIVDVELPKEEIDPIPVRETIFTNIEDNWNYAEEETHRNTENPYPLHRDEFYAEERNYSQITLTYYAGDDIMVDQEDAPVYNHVNVVGELQFGHGSGDQNVFYVRNDKMKAEYEIIKDPGLYSVEVLGLEIQENARTQDLQHAEPRRFKRE